MAKKLNLHATKSGEVDKVNQKEKFKALALKGEELGNKLIEHLSDYGCTLEGLWVETYAMSKAWGTLLAVAHDENLEPADLFYEFLPVFIEDAENIIKEMKKK